MNLPLTAPVEAFSTSASEHTINGSLPPNSKTHFLICPEALCATFAPTILLPVNVTALISESINFSAILESLTKVWKIPSGNPAFRNMFSISIPHCMVTLAGFRTIVFPAISDGAANLNACQYGKFHGMILAIIPIGSKAIKLFLASVLTTSVFRNVSPLSP